MEDYYIIYLPSINYFVPHRFVYLRQTLKYVAANYPDSFKDGCYRIDYCKHCRGSQL